MKNLEMARTLLDSAGRDLFVLRNAVDTPDYPDEIFGFHVSRSRKKVQGMARPVRRTFSFVSRPDAAVGQGKSR